MGQYFAAANIDKKEFVCPWCVGGVAKLWEWAANPWGAIFTLLLRKSTGSGGGDYYGYRTQNLELADQNSSDIAKSIASIAALEGRPIPHPGDAVVGRWAGDRVVLVGDYDDSKLWDELYDKKTYRNISAELVPVWNDFIEIDRMKLEYAPCSSCIEKHTQ